MRRSFDRLAPSYATLERMAFGRALQQTRTFCLPWADRAKTALLVGDGDGRFANALLRSNPNVTIDSLDASAGMLKQSAQRNQCYNNRIRFIHTDALRHAYDLAAYDFIALHFVLDCFTEQQVSTLMPRLRAALAPGGVISYADFQDTTFFRRLAVWCLFLFFRATTDITARTLPLAQWPLDWSLVGRREHLGGLLVAEVRQRPLINAADRERMKAGC